MGLTIYPAGNCDVVGPNSATDGHYAVFDGVTGKLIKDGGAATGGTVTTVTRTNPSTAGVQVSIATPTTTPAFSFSENIGFLEIPQNSKSADYTAALTDSGKDIYHPVGDTNSRQFTIPKNATIPFPLETCITYTNMSANDITVIIDTDVLNYVDVGAVTTITIPQYNYIVARKVTTTAWLAGGTAGITTA